MNSAYNSFKHLQETITISESDDSRDSVFEDFQTIDAEIIDYGVSEDECEQTSVISQSQLALPTRTSVAGSSADIVNKTKCLCVKLIDCDKYPWYYAKYKEQILRRKHGNTKTNIVTNDREVGKLTYDSSNIFNITPVINKTQEEDNVKQESCIAILTSPGISGKINNIYESNNEPAQNCRRYKKKLKIKNTVNKDKLVDMYISKSAELKDLNHQEPIQIDYQKNKGLVGMKIQTMKLEDKPKDKRTIKTKQQRHREGSKKKSKNRHNNMYNVENNIGSISSMNIPHFQTTLNKETVEIERDQNQKHLPASDFSNDVIKEKHSSLKCSLKIPSEKILEVIKKRRKIKCDVGEKEDNYADPDSHILNHKNNMLKRVEIGTEPKHNLETVSHMAVSGSTNDGHFNNSCNKILVDQRTNVVRRKPMPKSKKKEMDNLEYERLNLYDNKNKNIDQQIEKIKLSSSEVNRVLLKNIPINSSNANENIKKDTMCPPTKTDLKVLTKQLLNKEKVFTEVESTPKVHSKTTSTNRSIVVSDTPSSVSTKAMCVEQNIFKSDKASILQMKLNIDNSKFMTNHEVPSECLHLTNNSMHKHTDNTQKTDKPATQCQITSPVFNPIVSTQLRKVRKPNSPAKFTTIAKDGVFITTNAVSPDSKINESQNASEPHLSVRSRRKQPVKLRCIKNIDNIDNYVQTIRNIENYMNFEPNTQSTSRSNFKPFFNLPIESSKPQQTHIPDQPILTGRKPNPDIYITKEYNMPDIIPTINTLIPDYRQTPAICNRTNMESMPTAANFKHLPVNGVKSFLRASVLGTQTALPPCSTLSQGTRNQFTKKQLCPGANMQIRVPKQCRPQEMPTDYVYLNTCLGRGHNIQNNHMQQPEIIPNFANISQVKLGNPSRPPGICDVNPLYTHQTNNLQPRPPPPPYEAALSSIVASSIIGRNNDGVIKKINISNPANKIGNINSNTTKSCNISTNEKQSKKSEVQLETPALSKTDMMKELENAILIDSPVKPDLKRSCPNPSTGVNKSYRPGPLSKKLNFTNYVRPPFHNEEKTQTFVTNVDPARMQYSPPILPIPTYQTILSEIQTPTFQKTLNPPPSNIKESSDETISQKTTPKKTTRAVQPKEDSSKKISMEEYKTRVTDIEEKNRVNKTKKAKQKIVGQRRSSPGGTHIANEYSTKYHPNIDEDLGYLSGSKTIHLIQKLF